MNLASQSSLPYILFTTFPSTLQVGPPLFSHNLVTIRTIGLPSLLQAQHYFLPPRQSSSTDKTTHHSSIEHPYNQQTVSPGHHTFRHNTVTTCGRHNHTPGMWPSRLRHASTVLITLFHHTHPKGRWPPPANHPRLNSNHPVLSGFPSSPYILQFSKHKASRALLLHHFYFLLSISYSHSNQPRYNSFIHTTLTSEYQILSDTLTQLV